MQRKKTEKQNTEGTKNSKYKDTNPNLPVQYSTKYSKLCTLKGTIKIDNKIGHNYMYFKDIGKLRVNEWKTIRQL